MEYAAHAAIDAYAGPPKNGVVTSRWWRENAA